MSQIDSLKRIRNVHSNFSMCKKQPPNLIAIFHKIQFLLVKLVVHIFFDAIFLLSKGAFCYSHCPVFPSQVGNQVRSISRYVLNCCSSPRPIVFCLCCQNHPISFSLSAQLTVCNKVFFHIRQDELHQALKVHALHWWSHTFIFLTLRLNLGKKNQI